MIRRPPRSTLFPTRRSSDLNRLVVFFTDGETAPYFAGDLHEALRPAPHTRFVIVRFGSADERIFLGNRIRSEEHTSELQSHSDLVCRLLLEKKNNKN